MWTEDNERDYQRANAGTFTDTSQKASDDHKAYHEKIREEHAKGNWMYGDIGDYEHFVEERK